MSECYVAANMRTSFTDLPESGSLSSNLSTGGLSSAAQSNLSSSSDFHSHQQQQQHLKQEQQQQQQQFTSSTSSSSSSSQMQNLNHRPLSASEAASTHHDLIHSPHHSLNRTIEDHHLGGASGSINNINQHQQLQSVHSQTNHFGARNSHNHNHSYSIPNSIPHHRLSQPTRTQIPIHCYIEQLDACADLPGYNPTITDNELFSTSNKSLPNQQNHSNPYQQSHLHQSKLALESVTNQCNGILGNSSTRNETSSANIDLANDSLNVNDSDNNNEDIDSCSNNNSTINTNSGSLFHDSEVDNNPGGNDIDVNLDHLTSDSPNSTHNQLHSHQDSNNISASFNHIAPSSPAYDGHHFQACRETYAIVTSNVLYIDLLRTVLLQLGYSAMDLINAKGR